MCSFLGTQRETCLGCWDTTTGPPQRLVEKWQGNGAGFWFVLKQATKKSVLNFFFFFLIVKILVQPFIKEPIMDANVSEWISYRSVKLVPTINGMKTVPKPVDSTGARGKDRYHDGSQQDQGSDFLAKPWVLVQYNCQAAEGFLTPSLQHESYG